MSFPAATSILRPPYWRSLEFNPRPRWMGAFCRKQCRTENLSKWKRKCWKRQKDFQPAHGINVSKFPGSVRRSTLTKATASSSARPPGLGKNPISEAGPEISQLALILLEPGRYETANSFDHSF